jgi:hypothetical protein
MTDAQGPSPLSPPPLPQWNKAQRLWRGLSRTRKRLVAVFGALGFLGIGFGYLQSSYSFIVPDVEIKPGIVSSDTNPFAVEFVATNNGHFSLIYSVIECDVRPENMGEIRSKGNIVTERGRDQSQIIKTILPGKSITRNCMLPITYVPAPQYPASYKFTLESRWRSFWPTFPWTATGTFVSVRDAQGHIQIQPDSN